jgi:creatinine amidohydrolase
MRVASVMFAASILAAATPAVAQNSVFLEDLTSTEVRDAIRTGKTTVIIPTGGTEQNGPHMVLGKHNFVVKFTSGEIAKRLGGTLVAPVMAYAPEGTIDPPSGHMWAAGTITLPADDFAKVVEFAARSLRAHGFLDIVLIGDSGPNQAPLKAVAEALNSEWASTPVRVYHLNRYYDDPAFTAWLKGQDLSDEEIGTHAGIRDTSELLVVHPAGIRADKLSAARPSDGSRSGVVGNPTKASVAYGRKGLELKIDAAVRQFRELKLSATNRP